MQVGASLLSRQFQSAPSCIIFSRSATENRLTPSNQTAWRSLRNNSERLGTEVAPIGTPDDFGALQVPKSNNLSENCVGIIADLCCSLIVGWSANRCSGILGRPMRSAIESLTVRELSCCPLLMWRDRHATHRHSIPAQEEKLLV